MIPHRKLYIPTGWTTLPDFKEDLCTLATTISFKAHNLGLVAHSPAEQLSLHSSGWWVYLRLAQADMAMWWIEMKYSTKVREQHFVHLHIQQTLSLSTPIILLTQHATISVLLESCMDPQGHVYCSSLSDFEGYFQILWGSSASNMYKEECCPCQVRK